MAAIVNGADRGRPGRWLVDYRDEHGKRRWITCQSREEAKARLSEVLKIQPRGQRSTVSADITCGAYCTEHWLPAVKASAKRRTHEVYAGVWRLHLAPTLAERKVRAVESIEIRALLAGKMRDGASRGAARLMMATARAMLGQAVEDGVITSNPASGHGRRLRLIESKGSRQERIKAMDGETLSRFLRASAAEPRYADVFLLLARTGMRLGECLGLQWGDINFKESTVRIMRAFSKRHFETPKSGHGRTVDLSPELLARLQDRYRELEPTATSPVFSTGVGTNMDESKIRKSMSRILAAAGLGHYSPHDLRHTYASLLLQAGESPAYVQRQLGHASITLTVDLYGRWLPTQNGAAVAKLDAISPAVASGSKIRSNTQ